MALNKYYIAPFRWSKTVWIISIISTIVLIGTAIMCLITPELAEGFGRYVLTALLLPLPIVCFCLSPRYLCLYGPTLIIKRWVGSVTIPVGDIISVTEAERKTVMFSKRTLATTATTTITHTVSLGCLPPIYLTSILSAQQRVTM